MRRRVTGLGSIPKSPYRVPEGRLLVAVHRILFINGQKPYFAITFNVIEPETYSDCKFNTRLYSTERALWKLSWFLRDFGYDQHLLEQELIDEKALLGLHGIVRVSRVSVNGRAFTNVDAFAPASTWEMPAQPLSIIPSETAC